MSKKNANEVNNIADLQAWISQGQSVGFTFQGQTYRINYGAYADGQPYINLSEPEGYLSVNFIDMDEFMTYARVQGNYVSEIWPLVSDITLFIPQEEGQ